jgi:hypothetical protein
LGAPRHRRDAVPITGVEFHAIDATLFP